MYISQGFESAHGTRQRLLLNRRHFLRGVGACLALLLDQQLLPEAAVGLGFDASIFNGVPQLRPWGTWKNPFKKVLYAAFRHFEVPTILSYEKEIVTFVPDEMPETRYPSIVHAWDNSPRSKGRGVVLHGSTPALFRRALQKALRLTRGYNRHRDGRLIFLKSWNEWAEGNHLEPDLRDGHGYLQVIREEVDAERALVAKDAAT